MGTEQQTPKRKSIDVPKSNGYTLAETAIRAISDIQGLNPILKAILIVFVVLLVVAGLVIVGWHGGTSVIESMRLASSRMAGGR